MSIFGIHEEWPGAEPWLRSPRWGKEFFNSFVQAGFTEEQAAELACLSLEQDFGKVILQLHALTAPEEPSRTMTSW